MVEALIKKIFNKNIHYNILSLVNVFIGFLFILYLGRKFGAGSETDIYFLSMVIISYLGYFVQSVWEAMSPYYVELKIKDKKLSGELYSILLNDLILVALFIISIYFIITSNFNIITFEQKQFLDVFIFYLIFQNILFLNKTVLNLEHFYASFYIVDIFVYMGLFLSIYLYDDILYIAYISILFTFLANIWQFYLVFKKVDIRYSFKIYNKNIKEIYKNSFKLKIGSLFYGSKDIIIASVFTSFGTGAYSLYSYANKFAGVILQVVNAPIVNIFATKANYLIANKEYEKLQENIKKVLLQTTILFVSSTIITYFILPYILNVLFGDKFSTNDIILIREIFLIMSVFYLVLVYQSPYGRMLSMFKLFNFGIISNIIFFFVLIINYIIFQFFEYEYLLFLKITILAKLIQFIYVYCILRSVIFDSIGKYNEKKY